MNVCISVAEHELEMAHRWFSWVSELGGTDGHGLYVIPAFGLVGVEHIRAIADKAFNGRVTIIKDEEGQTSDWQKTEPMRSASGPNSSFRQAAWHFYMNKIGSYFWCELDCIPLRKDWLDRLESEYKACGKPFMGARVELESVPLHMSGNGIYQNVPQEAPTLVQRTNWTPKGQDQSYELAFDIAGAREVIPKAHWTNLIQHKFRYEGFKNRVEFDAIIDPNAVVFHSDKRGTIFPYLRENLIVGAKALDESGGIKTLAKTEIDSEFEPQHPSSIRDAAETPVWQGGNDARTYKDDNNTERFKSGLGAPTIPWQNKADSEQEVRRLCNALALFAKTPVYKHRVREALREAKIIK